MDVLSASFLDHDNKVAWYENTDGRGTFGEQRVITTAALGPKSVFAVDLDGDGDMDVLSASRSDDKIAWYENTDARGAFGEQKIITTAADAAQSVYAADLDADGDMDVLSASGSDEKIAWYENTDGMGAFGEQRVITTAADVGLSVHAADLDGDGDTDVLSAGGLLVAWYENTDGKGTFGEQQIVVSKLVVAAVAVYAADLDGDGDMDVLSASFRDNKIAWYENVSLLPGDANRDLQFDQNDVVQVLQAGKYLTGESATFAEGDWNDDGVFDELDIIAAQQTGNYLQGPYAARHDRSTFLVKNKILDHSSEVVETLMAAIV